MKTDTQSSIRMVQRNLEAKLLRALLWVVLLAGPRCLAADVRLAWDASPTPGVTNYLLYAHTNLLTATNLSASLLRFHVGTNLTATVEALQSGQWSFTVTAMKDGLESDPSNVLLVEVPQPPARMRTVVVQYSGTLNFQDGILSPAPAVKTDKPPYRVPSMAEIAAVSDNGLRVVSTFSGCGGSCLGYRMAGYRVLWASEFIPAAAETYRANHPDTILDTRDIRKVQPEDILKAIGLKAGELDGVEVVLHALPSAPPANAKHWGQPQALSETVPAGG
jgi:hypothetical protein